MLLALSPLLPSAVFETAAPAPTLAPMLLVWCCQSCSSCWHHCRCTNSDCCSTFLGVSCSASTAASAAPSAVVHDTSYSCVIFHPLISGMLSRVVLFLPTHMARCCLPWRPKWHLSILPLFLLFTWLHLAILRLLMQLTACWASTRQQPRHILQIVVIGRLASTSNSRFHFLFHL